MLHRLPDSSLGRKRRRRPLARQQRPAGTGRRHAGGRKQGADLIVPAICQPRRNREPGSHRALVTAVSGSDGTSLPDRARSPSNTAWLCGCMGFWIGRAISPLHTGLHAPFPLPPPSHPTQQAPRHEKQDTALRLCFFGHFAPFGGRHVSSRLQPLVQVGSVGCGQSTTRAGLHACLLPIAACVAVQPAQPNFCCPLVPGFGAQATTPLIKDHRPSKRPPQRPACLLATAPLSLVNGGRSCAECRGTGHDAML